MNLFLATRNLASIWRSPKVCLRITVKTTTSYFEKVLNIKVVDARTLIRLRKLVGSLHSHHFQRPFRSLQGPIHLLRWRVLTLDPYIFYLEIGRYISCFDCHAQ